MRFRLILIDPESEPVLSVLTTALSDLQEIGRNLKLCARGSPGNLELSVQPRFEYSYVWTST
jgi:hypothetical protein